MDSKAITMIRMINATKMGELEWSVWNEYYRTECAGYTVMIDKSRTSREISVNVAGRWFSIDYSDGDMRELRTVIEYSFASEEDLIRDFHFAFNDMFDCIPDRELGNYDPQSYLESLEF